MDANGTWSVIFSDKAILIRTGQRKPNQVVMDYATRSLWTDGVRVTPMGFWLGGYNAPLQVQRVKEMISMYTYAGMNSFFLSGVPDGPGKLQFDEIKEVHTPSPCLSRHVCMQTT